ncbi:MAG: hypothetical protein LBJ58_08680 [Tannerellaceae bacterium]|jgi:hypothetical protein|nr:hypothetical protein [Tannerellaceae bacterium]
MGFLKFIGHDVQKQGEQQSADNPPVPSPKVYVAKPTAPEPLPKKKKRQRGGIGDFFNIDIYNVFNYKPKAVGGDASKYALSLEKTELSSFNHVDIILHSGGSYDLHFTGNTETISKDMTDFVDYCAGALGPDFMQKKTFSENDARDMPLGAFSRIWYGRMRIENVHYTLSLTLYNIQPAK